MPAYNEQDNIISVIEQWHPIVEKVGSESRLIIYNDGSKDATYEVMKSLEEKFPQFIAKTKTNSGHGSTCLYAYNDAINAGADYVFQTDSDGQTDPDEFWAFWDQRENYDIGIGIRKERQDGTSRVFVTRVLRIVIRITFGVDVKDANTPFRLMKREKLKEYLKIVPKDFFLSNVIIAVIAVKQKQKIFWEQITFKPRQAGVNSINLKRIFKIGIQAVKDFRSINKQLSK